MNPLEEFILDHREELDHIEAVPEEQIWGKISQHFHPSAKREVGQHQANPWQISIGKNWLRLAASVVLAVGLGWYGLNSSTNTSSPAVELAQFSPELAKEQARYIELVKAKEEELGVDQLDREIFQEIFQELETWEVIYREYLKDLPTYQAKEEVVHTLSKYYERKIRILERLSRQMEIHYQQEKRKNEKRI